MRFDPSSYALSMLLVATIRPHTCPPALVFDSPRPFVNLVRCRSGSSVAAQPLTGTLTRRGNAALPMDPHLSIPSRPHRCRQGGCGFRSNLSTMGSMAAARHRRQVVSIAGHRLTLTHWTKSLPRDRTTSARLARTTNAFAEVMLPHVRIAPRPNAGSTGWHEATPNDVLSKDLDESTPPGTTTDIEHKDQQMSILSSHACRRDLASQCALGDSRAAVAVPVRMAHGAIRSALSSTSTPGPGAGLPGSEVPGSSAASSGMGLDPMP